MLKELILPHQVDITFQFYCVGFVEQNLYRAFTRPFFPSEYKRKKWSGYARLHGA